ncbi:MULTISPECIES: DUF3389 family protein [Shewanella]|uniref:DUF3389 family protein n=2 Tax=Shewanella TaxID=22 RepID=A0ABV7GA83_9GAMM|nr:MULTISPECIES: DUF3389 family protein [Shewanella]MCL1037574.1 DUF3389 domain-containing protein [Shewanella submarina]
MIIELSHSKLILTPFEIQIRMSPSGTVLSAMVEDLKLRKEVLVLSADAGAVRWSLKLDNQQQADDLVDFIGEQILL